MEIAAPLVAAVIGGLVIAVCMALIAGNAVVARQTGAWWFGLAVVIWIAVSGILQIG